MTHARIRDNLADKLNRNGIVGVRTQVACECGRADIVTVNEVTEVEHRNNWKHALGRALVYANCLGFKHKRLHLFYELADGVVYDRHDDAVILRACASCGVSVTFEKI